MAADAAAPTVYQSIAVTRRDALAADTPRPAIGSHRPERHNPGFITSHQRPLAPAVHIATPLYVNNV